MIVENDKLFDSREERIISIQNFDPQIGITLLDLDTLPFRNVFYDTPLIIDDSYDYMLAEIDTFPVRLLMTGINNQELISEFELSIVLTTVPGTYALHFFPNLRFSSKEVEFEGR